MELNMKLIAYLLMFLLAGSAVAQNPTILQGNYISNVFGNSNFVLNPNAQTSTANVTNATRSTSTPLVATSEFTLNLTNGSFATWTLRPFDSGMKGQNCEARFTYRGFATATSTAQIVQNSLVVAQLVLTPTTDPRIASINFPCGDLANATTFRIAQTTANMTTVTPNEIGGIYVGLATNMANVAQAELVVSANRSTPQSITNGVSTTIVFATENNDTYGEYDPTTGIFTAKRAGEYFVQSMILYTNAAWTVANSIDLNVLRDSSVICSQNYRIQYTGTTYHGNQISCHLTLSVGQQIRVQTYQDRGAATDLLGNGSTFYNRLQIYRFPSSSELVVTPERQNVWGSTDGSGADATTTSTSYVTPSGFTVNTKGKCLADGTNLACKISTLPPGTYKIDVALPYVSVGGSAAQSCYVQITDNKGASDSPTAQAVAQAGQTDAISNVSRIFTYTSVQTDIIFTLKHTQAAGLSGSCGIYTASASRRWQMTVTPLDQPSNSALYVQGPVLGAQTGAAIPAGYLGQTLSATAASNVPLANGVISYANLTLTTGIWSCFAYAVIEPGTGAFSTARLSINASSSSEGSVVQTIYPPSPANFITGATTPTTLVTVTTGTIAVYANVYAQSLTGNAYVRSGNGSGLQCWRIN